MTVRTPTAASSRRDESGARSGFDAAAVALVGLTAAALVAAAALFLQAMFLGALAKERQAKLIAPPNEALQALQAEQQARLQEGPRRLDEGGGREVIPIADAESRFLELQGGGEAAAAP